MITEFSEFLESFSVRYERCGTLFSFPEQDITVRLVPLDDTACAADAVKIQDGCDRSIYLYEIAGGVAVRCFANEFWLI